MYKMNAAQALMVALGAPETAVLFGHKNGVAGGRRRHNNTKKGTGRIHFSGKIVEK